MGLKLLIVGAGGRMGRRILSVAAESEQFSVVGAVENKGHPELGKDAGIVAGVGSIGVEITAEFPPGAEVVIDFSQPQAVDATIGYCIEQKCSLVMGTTALSAEQQEKLKNAGGKTAVLYGSNMSVGMNVLFALIGKVASMLGEDYDTEIIEQHHRFKKDAPSGTALTLAENICKATGRKFADCVTCGRAGKDSLRKKGSIGIQAVRTGNITGIHSVVFAALGEKVTLNHTAHSRDTFARGALRAAKWLAGKKPGLYSMADVLGLE
ncbi:4-hydroxy-tetrahydrodipicolinate reductase [Planctomycetota bacterium]